MANLFIKFIGFTSFYLYPCKITHRLSLILYRTVSTSLDQQLHQLKITNFNSVVKMCITV